MPLAKQSLERTIGTGGHVASRVSCTRFKPACSDPGCWATRGRSGVVALWEARCGSRPFILQVVVGGNGRPPARPTKGAADATAAAFWA
jgi:hypothetical protein